MLLKRDEGYTVGFDANRVVVRHKGRVCVPCVTTSQRAAGEMAEKNDLPRLLYDLSEATNPLQTAELFNFCVNQARVLPPGVTVALLLGPGLYDIEDAAFAEIVSVNRGIRFGAFTDAQAADVWLSGTGALLKPDPPALDPEHAQRPSLRLA